MHNQSPEIVQKILFGLDVQSLLNFCLTSKYYYQFYQDEHLWKSLYNRDFVDIIKRHENSPPGLDTNNQKKRYISFYLCFQWKKELTNTNPIKTANFNYLKQSLYTLCEILDFADFYKMLWQVIPSHLFNDEQYDFYLRRVINTDEMIILYMSILYYVIFKEIATSMQNQDDQLPKKHMVTDYVSIVLVQNTTQMTFDYYHNILLKISKCKNADKISDKDIILLISNIIEHRRCRLANWKKLAITENNIKDTIASIFEKYNCQLITIWGLVI
jgi:hypothetical protein